MSTTHQENPVLLTGLGPICPTALRRKERSHDGSAATSEETSWFDVGCWLGPRGWKYMTPATRYLLAASRLALEHAGLTDARPALVGVAVGTNTAVDRVHDQMDRVILSEGADFLSPAEAANFSVNVAAGYVSIKHAAKAFNITFTTPATAGMEAVIFGAQALEGGRADAVIVAAYEDEPNAGLTAALGGIFEPGAVVFVLERARDACMRGARRYGCVSGTALRFISPDLLRSSATDVRVIVDEALARVLRPGQRTVEYAPVIFPDPHAAAVDHVIRQALSARHIDFGLAHGAGADGRALSMSPLLLITESLLYRGGSLLVACPSPCGHLGLLLIDREEEYTCT